MSQRNLKFALIWWVECKQIDIIPSSQLPKNNKGVGSVVKLKWRDSVKKKFEQYEAKILALGASEDEMNNIIVDNEGKISSFGRDIQASKRKHSNNESEKLKARKKFMFKKQEIIKTDENLPFLNLNPSTSTATSASTKLNINFHSAVNNNTKNGNCSSESSSEEDDDNNVKNEGLSRDHILGNVSLRDIAHMELFVAFMKCQYEMQQRNRYVSNKNNKK